MNSSSSLPFPAPLQEKYDVFLSFRGQDTRDAFTSHLHAALLRKQIETYIDNRLEKGDDIGPSLKEAIKKSKIALVIFSKNYASSTWCLKELVHILECKKSYGQIVIPVFYRIDPSLVRKQQGTYALEDRPLKRCRDEVANWRAALEEAANMSGFHYSIKTGTEAHFVEKVAQDIWTKLNRELSSDLRGLVGIERKIEKIESLLCLGSPGVCCVGIWGMGGIGKTTLADAVFHRLSSKFEASCFLPNVREKSSEQTDGLKQLRNTLLGEILKDSFNINTPSIPPNTRDRLKRPKALIVLDDVNDPSQLEFLVGNHDQFCQGSRIIITARDKGVLEQKVDHEKIYKVEGLSSNEALQLFHSHAFRNKSPTTEYNALSRKVVDYINGIPLGLKVMGSLFLGCKSKQEWEDQLNKLKRFPSEQIKKVLRASYDGLEENEKEIFLDIACFHKRYNRNYVKEFSDSRGFFGEVGIKVLIDRSLISISKDMRSDEWLDMRSEEWLDVLSNKLSEIWIDMPSQERIEMHDLVQEMGRAIALEQRIEERTRLFNAKDVFQVLTNNQRDGHVQAISFDMSKIEKLRLELQHANFEKMYQLKCLRVSDYLRLFLSIDPLIVSIDLPNSLRYLDWKGYPLKSLPSKFSAQNLLVLSMPYSKVGAQLWNEDQSPVNLKWISLRFSRYLTEVPNLSQSIKIERIDLSSCGSLVEIPSYFQHLGNLTYLDLGRCKNLKNLPEMPCNLELLNLCNTAIEELPSSVWSHEKISHLDITFCKHLKSLPSNSCKLKLSGSFILCGESLCQFWELPRDTTVLKLRNTLIKELPSSSIDCLSGLTTIELEACENLVSLPTNIWELKSLESLDLSQCSKFQNFPEISEAVEHLKFLNLSGTAIKEVPPSIGNLVDLRKLDLSHCKNLEVIPDYLFRLTSLQELNLSSTKIKNLPASIKQAAQLSRLCLSDCKSLESLPELPPSLKTLCSSLKYIFSQGPTNKKYLERLDLNGCSNFQHFPEISKAMEHLKFLNLSGTSVKEVPPSIGNLLELRTLDLSDCKNLEVVPDYLFCLTSLQELNLSSSEIKSLPASIKQAAQLSRLCLSDCKSLESLPELPPLLQCLEAVGCTSLKTVSSSSIAITQGWEEYIFSQRLDENHIFFDCPKLDENARSNIMADAQLRIMRMATASSKFKEDKIEEKIEKEFEQVAIRCWGYEIPKWFSHQSKGCSIKIELPRDWFSTDFLGFALSLVVGCAPWNMMIGCKYNFKTSNGESHEVNHPLCNDELSLRSRDSHGVFVWWYNNVFEEVVEGAPSPTAFYNRFTEVNVDFNDVLTIYNEPFPAEKCGVCLLYGKDAEMIKQRALYAQDA